MTDAPTRAADYTVDDFIKEISNADRVVVETKSALGEMDAHYMPASVVLKALNTRTDQHLALVAAAYEYCAQEMDEWGVTRDTPLANVLRKATPDDAQAALDRMKREAWQQGYETGTGEIAGALDEAAAAKRMYLKARKEALREAAASIWRHRKVVPVSFLAAMEANILALMEDTDDE